MGLSQFEERAAWADWYDVDDGWAPGITDFGNNSFQRVRIDSILLTTTDVIDVAVPFWFFHNSVAQALLGTVVVPAGSGSSGLLPAIDAIPLLFPETGNFQITSQWTLAWELLATLTATKHLYIAAFGGFL